MRYEIDTIPVWDALRTDCECWMCHLETKARNAALRYYLGDSVMIPETRVLVNDKGFSPGHWRLLAKDTNRQGLGLIASTHLRTLAGKLREKSRSLWKEAEKTAAKTGPAALLASKDPLKKGISDLVDFLIREESTCLIQERIDAALDRYAFTAAHLFIKDKDFAPVLLNSKGPCLPHLRRLLTVGAETLGAPDLARWTKTNLELCFSGLERLEEEVVHFTQMFDSKNLGADWGNTKDSPERVIQKITAVFPERDESKGKR